MERRHVLSVEDHLYHTAELLETIARVCPEMLAWTTVCSIDEPGPDSSLAVNSWLASFDGVQVAARVDAREVPPEHAGRLFTIEADHLGSPAAFARMLASFLLPDAVLLQDVHLSTLHFVPADRWWESIYVAATVRGLFARHQPAVRFVSNKRGYAATFGRDLMDAGFDPREVMDKAELESVIVPSIVADLDARFPLALTTADRPAGIPVAAHDAARQEIERALDLVEWDVGGRVELGGRLLAAPVAFRAGSQEGMTWQQLIADRIEGGPGIPIAEVGLRLSDAGAERAEISNLAARHIHALRARLSSSAAIVTANRAYGLDPAVSAGRVRRRRATDLRPPPVSRAQRTDPPA